MTDPMLFPEARPAPPTAAGLYASVALEVSIDRALDYAVPEGLAKSIRVGQRVRVPLGRGNRPTHGYVTDLHPTPATTAKIKPILGIDDDRILVPPRLMELSQWMARYYCCPLGTVLDSVIPSAVKKRIGLEYVPMVRLAQPAEMIQGILEKTRAKKRKALLARLLQLQPSEAEDLFRLASDAQVTPATVRKLAGLGLISITPEASCDVLPKGEAAPHVPEAGHALNGKQQKAFEAMLPRVRDGGFSVTLVHGVTGSGKTELYLRCIEEAVSRGRRAIVLVPEIALTPQTVRRFTARFPRVAVLHSGLSAGTRHRYWQQIAQGGAQVVVGARSAIFAPMPDLGIIVVDEEHEPSYKQDTAPRYHGRDVAIKRAQLEGVPVLLGSATPSLESWRLCGGAGENGPSGSAYGLVQLPHRVRGLQLPHVEVVDMGQERRLRPGVHLLSQRLEHLLRTTIEAKRQAILLLNRRGYASFVHCSSCGHLVHCKYCDVTMTYHRTAGMSVGSAAIEKNLHAGQLQCHYCLAVNSLPDKCPECAKKLSLFGLGTQRVEEELGRKMPDLRFARVDSDSMHSARDYESVLARFGKGEIQVLLGTQMIAKGLDFPNVTLVGVISGDTALSLPDFRASERTFQLITQVAGRAGRGDAPGRVVLQTFQPDSPVIQSAIQQDFERFAAGELRSRREVGLPPFTRMARIIIRDEDVEKAQELADGVAAAVGAAIAESPDEDAVVAMKGPMPAAINRIAGYHRMQVLLTSPSAAAIQRVLASARRHGAFAASDRIAVDVDPVALL